MTPVLGHGVGSVQDLPVPQWLFLYGAGVVLVVSFLALALLWQRPVLERESGRALPEALQRSLLAPALRVALGALGFALLVFVMATALLGERSAATNIAPTFVYVAFWLGLVPVVVLLGNVWAWLNPWRAAADGLAALARSVVGASDPPFSYPSRLGRWPAVLGLFAFASLELAWHDPADPRHLALAVFLYSGVQWIGSLVFGRHAWFQNAEAFSVYFWLLSRIAPFDVRRRDGERELVARPPLVGLAALRDPRPGTIAFVAVMLGSVGFDGFSRTSVWQDLLVGRAELERTVLDVAGLLAAVLAVALAYGLAILAARSLTRSRAALSGAFAASLVPIALVYAVSHYFSLLVVQGQFLVPLASDPFGYGWNLVGSRDFRPDLAPLSPSSIWYVQVATLVTGHVAGLVLAHDRALALFRDGRQAVRSQVPFLVLMVAYTVAGLWLLSQD